MTGPAVDTLTGVEGGEAAADAASTAGTAKTMASIIAKGMQGPPKAAEGTARVEGDRTLPGGEIAPLEGVEGVVEGTTEEVVEFDATELSEAEQALADLGVPLDITSAEVPPELLPAYTKMIQAVADQQQGYLADQMQVSQGLKEIESFKQRLDTQTDKILLAIAVTKPDVFRKVAEVVALMDQDPAQKDLVIRELEAEAKLQAVTRKEQLLGEGERRMKARAVKAALNVATRRHNVDRNVAENYVAAIIQRDGDLNPSEVDAIVATLKPQTKKVIQRIASPQKAAAAKTVPGQPVAGANAPAQPGRPAPAADGKPSSGQLFRRLIREAGQRLTAGRE